MRNGSHVGAGRSTASRAPSNGLTNCHGVRMVDAKNQNSAASTPYFTSIKTTPLIAYVARSTRLETPNQVWSVIITRFSLIFHQSPLSMSVTQARRASLKLRLSPVHGASTFRPAIYRGLRNPYRIVSASPIHGAYAGDLRALAPRSLFTAQLQRAQTRGPAAITSKYSLDPPPKPQPTTSHNPAAAIESPVYRRTFLRLAIQQLQACPARPQMALAYRESGGNRTQFSLRSLFEYTTICCVLAALSSFTGIQSTFCLMAFSLALAANQGRVAIAVLAATSMAAELPIQGDQTFSALRQFTTLFIAGSLGAWYCCRRHAHESRPSADAHSPSRHLSPDAFG